MRIETKWSDAPIDLGAIGRTGENAARVIEFDCTETQPCADRAAEAEKAPRLFERRFRSPPGAGRRLIRFHPQAGRRCAGNAESAASSADRWGVPACKQTDVFCGYSAKMLRPAVRAPSLFHAPVRTHSYGNVRNEGKNV